MKTKLYSLFPAICLSATLLHARAIPASGPNAVPAQAQVTLKRIEESAATIADTADRLELMARSNRYDADSYLLGLYTLRDGVNGAGRALQSLDAERAELAPWEVEAVAEAQELLAKVAADVTSATATFNADQGRLWATSFSDSMADARRQARDTESVIGNNLKLAQLRTKGQRVMAKIGNSSSD